MTTYKKQDAQTVTRQSMANMGYTRVTAATVTGSFSAIVCIVAGDVVAQDSTGVGDDLVTTGAYGDGGNTISLTAGQVIPFRCDSVTASASGVFMLAHEN